MRLTHAFTTLALLSSIGTARGQAASSPPADLVVTNARIYTVDDGRPIAEAATS